MDFLLSQDNILIFAVALISGLMLLLPKLGRGAGGQAINTVQAIQMINHQHAVLVDVRTAEQYQAGHIAQARSVPFADLDKKAASLPKDKPLVVVCDTGRDAGKAAKVLRREGHTQAVPLEGGMRAWLQAGLPVARRS